MYYTTNYTAFTLPKPKNQTFRYTRRITPKRVTSWRCPSPRHRHCV